jgi:hypothetical protein
MMKLLPLVALLLAGCASTAPVTLEGVQSADAGGVTGCRYVDDVAGSSTVGGSMGLDRARLEALEQAKAAGANRVVWVPLGQSGFGWVRVAGKAYKCPA